MCSNEFWNGLQTSGEIMFGTFFLCAERERERERERESGRKIKRESFVVCSKFKC